MKTAPLAALCAMLTTLAQAADAPPVGSALYARTCAACHNTPDNSRAPSLRMLRGLSPSAVVNALTNGKMAVQGEKLSNPERVALAEFMTGRSVQDAPAQVVAAACAHSDPLAESLAKPAWNGWGRTDHNDRFQSAADAGMNATTVPRLQLAWAFGFQDALSARAQPTVLGNWLFTAGDNGEVFALDTRTGCLRWTFKADTGVRSALTVGSRSSASGVQHTVYFGDGRAQAYALNAQTGQLLWKRRIETHENGAITGSPKLHAGRAYFAVAGAGEEVRGGILDYSCCTLRGSVSALDAATGAILWKTYSIAAEPQPKGRNPRGVQQYGPAGGGIWNSPTIDAKRGLLYVGTGNGFAEPAQPTTNSILAIDLLTGMIRWKFQALANDVWLWQCDPGTPTHTANCPRNQGPDHDFGSSPLLVTTPAGRDLVIAAQKSGMLWALDPDRAGAVVWQYRLGAGSPLNGQWGAASDGRNVYAGSSEAKGPAPGGIHAVDLDTGRRTWFTPAQPQLCGDAPPPTCFASQGAAASVIPGVVFSGSVDGGLRAYSTKDGAVLWTYDSNRYFDTVNGVIARGASMDASGPVIAGGMLFVNSGYAGLVGRPGNVLLAFRLE